MKHQEILNDIYLFRLMVYYISLQKLENIPLILRSRLSQIVQKAIEVYLFHIFQNQIILWTLFLFLSFSKVSLLQFYLFNLFYSKDSEVNFSIQLVHIRVFSIPFLLHTLNFHKLQKMIQSLLHLLDICIYLNNF